MKFLRKGEKIKDSTGYISEKLNSSDNSKDNFSRILKEQGLRYWSSSSHPNNPKTSICLTIFLIPPLTTKTKL
jgi:hypothetical protein